MSKKFTLCTWFSFLYPPPLLDPISKDYVKCCVEYGEQVSSRNVIVSPHLVTDFAKSMLIRPERTLFSFCTKSNRYLLKNLSLVQPLVHLHCFALVQTCFSLTSWCDIHLRSTLLSVSFRPFCTVLPEWGL